MNSLDSVLTSLPLLLSPDELVVDLLRVRAEGPAMRTSSSSGSLRSGATFSLLQNTSTPSKYPPRLERVFLIGEGVAICCPLPALEMVEDEETERGRLKVDEVGGV
jgi:hypothetical protein